MHLVKNAQEREKLQETPTIGNIATVAGVYSDGIALILPGDTEATEKHYPYNASTAYPASLSRLAATTLTKTASNGCATRWTWREG